MRTALVAALVAALLFGPLWAIGELGVWAFEEPRSHLVWDEATGAPDPADEPGGPAGLAARLLAGPLLVGLAWSIHAVHAVRAGGAGRADRDGPRQGPGRLAP